MTHIIVNVRNKKKTRVCFRTLAWFTGYWLSFFDKGRKLRIKRLFFYYDDVQWMIEGWCHSLVWFSLFLGLSENSNPKYFLSFYCRSMMWRLVYLAVVAVAYAKISLDGERCGQFQCKFEQYCSSETNKCANCSDACNTTHHNSDPGVCTNLCQGNFIDWEGKLVYKETCLRRVAFKYCILK